MKSISNKLPFLLVIKGKHLEVQGFEGELIGFLLVGIYQVKSLTQRQLHVLLHLAHLHEED